MVILGHPWQAACHKRTARNRSSHPVLYLMLCPSLLARSEPHIPHGFVLPQPFRLFPIAQLVDARHDGMEVDDTPNDLCFFVVLFCFPRDK